MPQLRERYRGIPLRCWQVADDKRFRINFPLKFSDDYDFEDGDYFLMQELKAKNPRMEAIERSGIELILRYRKADSDSKSLFYSDEREARL